MISCKKATQLISKSMEEDLSMIESVQLKMHLFICEFCELFRTQLISLRKALGKGPAEKESQPQLSDSCKAKLKEIVKNK